MKNVTIIGIGKLGLCFALTLEKAGYNVLGLDINQDYVDSVNNKTLNSHEDGVEELLKNSQNFCATTDMGIALQHSDLLFVIVATPSLENGRYDHSQVDSVVSSLSKFGVQDNKELIICCTTMPTYCDSLQDRVRDLGYTVTYNPEFIAQGTILRDQSRPDMVLIGEGSKKIGDALEEMYHVMTDNNPRICRMSRTEAEICKISLNCFLTTKISFANMVGDIAIANGLPPQNILDAIGSDTRIGNKYLRHGYGYGGPCFPRDNRALAIFANDIGRPAPISVATDDMNQLHLEFQIQEFMKSNPIDKPVFLDTVTYKPDTVIIEESQQLAFAVGLAFAGYKVVITESQPVISELQEKYGDLFEYRVREQ